MLKHKMQVKKNGLNSLAKKFCFLGAEIYSAPFLYNIIYVHESMIKLINIFENIFKKSIAYSVKTYIMIIEKANKKSGLRYWELKSKKDLVSICQYCIGHMLF